MAKSAPALTIRDGSIKAVLWTNQSANGVFVSTTFAKTYDDNGTLKDSNSFTGTDVLRLAEVAREAYRASNRIRREMNAKAQEDAETSISPAQTAHHL